jgi:hypothetical protein
MPHLAEDGEARPNMLAGARRRELHCPRATANEEVTFGARRDRGRDSTLINTAN